MVADTVATREHVWEILEKIKGRIHDTVTAPPVTATDIHRWAMAVYWPVKPPRLFWDAEYARGTRWGGIVAPVEFNPFAWPLEGSGHRPAWPDFGRRRFSFSAGNEAEYHTSIRPGDVITGASSVVDIYEKTGRSGNLLFALAEAQLTNQRDQLVKVLRHTLVFIFDRAGDPPRTAERVLVVPEGDPHQQWASRAAAETRGALFDDVVEGESLPTFQRYTDLMNFNRYAAVNDEFVYHHADLDVANSRGQKDVDGMGLLQFAYLHNLLRQWVGEEGDIQRVGVQYRANNGRGDIVTCHGRAVSKCQEGGLNLVNVDMWTENQRGETLSPGNATVSLLSRPV